MGIISSAIQILSTKLDREGASLQDQTVGYLNQAVASLDSCISCLMREKGIGAEMGIEKIEKLREEVNRYKKNVNNIPS